MLKQNPSNLIKLFLAIAVGFFSIFIGIYLLYDYFIDKKALSPSNQWSSFAFTFILISYGIWRIYKILNSR